VSFEFPKQLPKEWIKAIERNGKVGSEIRGLKVVGRDERGTIVHVSRDGFKILHGEENQNVLGNPLVGEGLDPNFGYETIGGSASDMESGGVGYIKGSIFSIPDAGTADSITVALKRYVAGSDKFKCAIYKHSDLSLVGGTEERTLSMTTSFAWYTFNFNAPKPSLTANEVYLLVVWAKYTTQYLYIAWAAGDANQGHYRAVAYNGFPDPWSPAPYHDAHKYSIYCTYTVSGAPTYIDVSDSGSGVDSVVVGEFYPTLLTFKDKYVVASTTAVTTTSDTLVDDTEASQTFNLAASQVVLAIYQANNVYGAAMPHLGMQNAVNVDGVDKANSWDSGGNPDNCTRNCVFWLGTLAAGSHTIKGRFASRTSGSTATISNRVLLIYIFDGDTYQYVDDATVATAPDTTMIDDPYAQVTFTPSATCKALVMYNCANSGGVADESVYGKKAAINVAGTDYGQAEKSSGSASANYVDSVFTVHALSLSAVSTTVKGRFANAGTAETVTINRRQLAVLLLADSTLMDVVTSTTQVSTTLSSLIDDAQATISRTTTDTRELLVVAMGTKRSGTSAGHYGECYGIKINANDRTNLRGSPAGLAYADSAATTHAEQLAAGSHTVQGRFSNNSGTETATIDARQVVALWFSGGAAPTYVNVSDSGLGADVLYNLSATLTLAESGSGTDGLDMQAALPLSDSGVGSDALQSIGLPLADVGSGTDVLNVQGQLPLSDVGSGLDSASMQGSLTLSDVGAGSDLSSLQAQLSLADSGVGADVLQSIGIPILESGVGADVPSMLGQLSLADSGLGTEYVSAGFYLTVSDSGSGIETLSMLGQLALADSAVGIDILSQLQAQLPIGDSGLGTDVLQSIGLPLSDSGSGLDVPLLQGQLQLSDAGVGTDILSQLQAQLPVSDAGLGSELFGLQGSLTLADVGNGVDSPSLLAQLSLADSALGSDLLSLLTQVLLSDSGLGTESIDIYIGEIIKAFLDSGLGADSVSLLAQLLLADSGNGVDFASLTAQLSLSDSGVGVDSAVASFFLTVSDSGTGVDSVSQLQAQLSLADSGVGSEGFQLQGSFTISDSGLGTEIVYAGVPGAKVTKLFLIIGDLAIQLAGS
jgi:hypothetical protein